MTVRSKKNDQQSSLDYLDNQQRLPHFAYKIFLLLSVFEVAKDVVTLVCPQKANEHVDVCPEAQNLLQVAKSTS